MSATTHRARATHEVAFCFLLNQLLAREEWERRRSEWLPTAEDRAYLESLQRAVTEPGTIANWIARPARGIKGLPFEYEYVRLD